MPAQNSGPTTAETINQPRRLIVTVYALYARDTDNWLSVSSIVRLLGQLGVDEPAVRSSISRLKRRGLLVSTKVNGAAGYSLSESALDIIREGDRRIFHRTRATLDAGWLLAVFSIPESEREKRHAMRTMLSRLGFGTAAPGVWIAPAHLHDEAAEALSRSGLAQFVDLFQATHVAFGDLGDKVAQWWDLDQLHDLYADFIDRYEPLRARNRRRRRIPPEEAFTGYVHVLTTWRRLPYLDPGLPLELLPADWNGARAAELFDWLQRSLVDPAHDYARSIIADSVG
ncbi:PaaX family transcriptional regulator [Rhodococcus spongiicola]|uniref:PaaX family transcriptional regulator n=1 Tax=Rhodococcus spongiicola TaxID=2487352 RepID=A0A3S3A976_9NOCA|nr:PaaX family transcriptional regulator C-terminal domain-containing protein [Rhodococcus spongiicola]RVW02594.1 PaaX family transcriptional regulator [Rhodococcus spongiicola]